VLLLLAASLAFAFSFGLIKDHLAGHDPVLVAAVRLALAALAFLPWTLRHAPPRRLAARAALTGALQFGLMYVLYIAAFRRLPAYGVAFWTIFTPAYVLLLDGRLGRTRRGGLAVLLAIAGAATVVWRAADLGDPLGIALVQGSNLCFAAGQVWYRRLAPRGTTLAAEAGMLGWMYLGAAALAAAGVLVPGARGATTFVPGTWWVLIYLGLVPTAAGFALWNLGAARTNGRTLAVANNLKIPLAVLVSWLVFAEDAAHGRVLAGLALIIVGLFAAGAPREESRCST
jgi:drug/metabolite transporter (DMT)-like permease